MPDMGWSSANEACDVKSLRGIQYLHDGQRPPKKGDGGDWNGKAERP
jgi:hypothetical protein